MHRIDTTTKAVDLFGSGKHGFKDGNKSSGIAATAFNASWVNSVQEEIANVIEGAGITLDNAANTQLQQAIQNMINGGDYKPSVRAASVGNTASLSGTATIDGVSLIAGDRVLIKDNATASQNGIYVVAAGAWPRATDADTGSELNGGAIVAVEEGTVNADTIWGLTNDGTVTIGTTALVFAQKSAWLASSAEAQALASTLKSISPATLAAAFQGGNQLRAATGYQKLPGGLIMQWGYFNQTGSPLAAGGIYSAANQSFPIAFPTGCLWMNGSSTYNYCIAQAAVVSNSQFQPRFSSNATGAINVDLNWIAIGY